jgi:hypothetical protein
MASVKTKLSFEQWLAEVDEICIAEVGLSIHDLDDFLWFDTYEKNRTPKQAYKTFYNKVIKSFM